VLCLYCQRPIDPRSGWRSLASRVVGGVAEVLRAAHECCYREYREGAWKGSISTQEPNVGPISPKQAVEYREE
jgi:hypothetical protein